jgi:hypothetical protein
MKAGDAGKRRSLGGREPRTKPKVRERDWGDGIFLLEESVTHFGEGPRSGNEKLAIKMAKYMAGVLN